METGKEFICYFRIQGSERSIDLRIWERDKGSWMTEVAGVGFEGRRRTFGFFSPLCWVIFPLCFKSFQREWLELIQDAISIVMDKTTDT